MLQKEKDLPSSCTWHGSPFCSGKYRSVPKKVLFSSKPIRKARVSTCFPSSGELFLEAMSKNFGMRLSGMISIFCKIRIKISLCKARKYLKIFLDILNLLWINTRCLQKYCKMRQNVANFSNRSKKKANMLQNAQK